MKGKKIGEDKYSEQWSLGGHSSVWVPKWVIEQVREEERQRISKEIGKRIDEWESGEDWDGTLNDGLYALAQFVQTPPITNNKN